jgi:Flp pilus assembly protein TadG
MIRDEKGGSLVEFAVIAPLLFVILFGIIEFGILLYDKAMLTNASREGARAGIVYDYDDGGTADDPDDDTFHPDDATIIAAVENYCEDYLISFGAGSNLGFDITRTGTASGDSLRVTVTYPFRFLVFSNLIALLGGDLENLVNLDAVTVMRLE